jgi:hypothetical protein
MTSKADFTSHIVDLFEAFGKVEAKRMPESVSSSPSQLRLY